MATARSLPELDTRHDYRARQGSSNVAGDGVVRWRIMLPAD